MQMKFVDLLKKYEGLILILGLVVLLRIPSLYEPAWYGDENIYLTIGQGMRKGLVLYKDITDYPNKPPLIYLLAALAGSVFRFRFILLIWNLIHATVMNLLLKKLFSNNKWLVWGGTLVFVLLTSLPILEGNIANGEIFMTMPVTAGMLLLWEAKSLRDYFLAGAMFALGFLFKIPVAADLIAAGLFFGPKLALGLGFGLPVLVILGLWQLQGVAASWLIANAVGSSQYVSVWGGVSTLQVRLIVTLVISGVIFLARKQLRPVAMLASLWFIWALFGALLSGRPYLHYLIQVVVPLILVVSAGVGTRKVGEGVILSLVILLGGGAFWLFGFKLGSVVKYYRNFGEFVVGQKSFEEYIRTYDGRMPRNYQLAKYLRTHTGPEERIYIWGTEPDIYVLSDRLPVGRLTTSFHVEDLNEYERLGRELAQVTPPYIVIMKTEKRDFAQLKTLVEARYILVETMGEAEIYRRVL